MGEDYESYVPGAVAKCTEDVIGIVNEEQYDFEKVKPFFEAAYMYQDGNSTKRVVEMVKAHA